MAKSIKDPLTNYTKIAQLLTKHLKDEDVEGYVLSGHLIQFYTPQPVVFLREAIQVTERIIDYSELLETVSVMYHSTSRALKHVNGWVDTAWCMTQFFEDGIDDCTDYPTIVDAICYQMNIASKCIRMAALFDIRAEATDKPIGKGILFTVSALLRKFADAVILNVDVIRAKLGSRNEDIEIWYQHQIPNYLIHTATAHQVPRMDAYFEGGVLLQTTYKDPLKGKYQTQKAYDEAKLCKSVYKDIVDSLTHVYHAITGGAASAE